MAREEISGKDVVLTLRDEDFEVDYVAKLIKLTTAKIQQLKEGLRNEFILREKMLFWVSKDTHCSEALFYAIKLKNFNEGEKYGNISNLRYQKKTSHF